MALGLFPKRDRFSLQHLSMPFYGGRRTLAQFTGCAKTTDIDVASRGFFARVTANVGETRGILSRRTFVDEHRFRSWLAFLENQTRDECIAV